LLSRDYPQYRDAQWQTGLLAIQEKRFKDAEDIFRKLGDRKDDVRPAVGLASTYSSQRQYDKAIEILRQEEKKTPSSSAVQNVLALTAIQAGQYGLAIENFQRILEANPKSIEAHVNLAEAYRLNGDVTHALDLLEQARGLPTNNPVSVRVLATAFHNVGRMEDSKAALRRYLQLQPADVEIMNNLAFLIVETGGDSNEAQKLAEQAVQKDGSNLHARDTLGWIYLKKSKPDVAIQIFNNLVHKQPENATFRYHLGVALLQKGEKNKARTELQAALAKKTSTGRRKKDPGIAGGD
jgi:tetratricopeptide (TPR) repeat protein